MQALKCSPMDCERMHSVLNWVMNCCIPRSTTPHPQQVLFCLYIFLFPFGFHLSLKTLLCHGHEYLVLYKYAVIILIPFAIFSLWSEFGCIQIVVYIWLYSGCGLQRFLRLQPGVGGSGGGATGGQHECRDRPRQTQADITIHLCRQDL